MVLHQRRFNKPDVRSSSTLCGGVGVLVRSFAREQAAVRPRRAASVAAIV
jgi:hypothetical protein